MWKMWKMFCCDGNGEEETGSAKLLHLLLMIVLPGQTMRYRSETESTKRPSKRDPMTLDEDALLGDNELVVP